MAERLTALSASRPEQAPVERGGRAAGARRALARLEVLAGTRAGAAWLFAAGLAVYALQSVAMPIFPGRDIGTYLRYYDQFFNGVAAPMSMLYRTPLSPLVVGAPLDLLGALPTQVLLGVLYAGSITAWAAAAAAWGSRAALATAAVLLVYPAYGYLFHALAGDMVCAAAVAGWVLLVVRAARRPSVRRYALVGLGVGALALVRPGNQVLLAVAVLPLLLEGVRRAPLARAAAVVAAGAAVIALWTVHNGLRLSDWQLARGSGAYFPFYRALIADHIVSPENGPSSREFAAAVQRDVLPFEPYRSYGVGLDDFFRRADPRMFEDSLNLSDRVWGWDSRYSILRKVGLEALRAHPTRYARGVAHTLWLEVWGTAVYVLPEEQAAARATATSTVETASGELPTPSEGSLIPAAQTGFYSTTEDSSIREVWTSPIEHHLVFDDPARGRRFHEMDANVVRLMARLPAYDPPDAATAAFNLLSRAYPRPVLWLVLGLAVVALRRPRQTLLALAIPALCLVPFAFTALAIDAYLEFALPFLPSFMLLAAIGVFGVAKRSPV